MMTRYYRFAGIVAAVSMPEALFSGNEYRLASFRTEPAEPDWEITFEQKDRLSEPEGCLVSKQENLQFFAENDHSIRYIDPIGDDWSQAAARVDLRGNRIHTQVKKERLPGCIPTKYVLRCMAVEHMIARNQGFVFHCSYIDRGGKAILFTAPSGVGKSTQADLWFRHRGAEIINGDRAAVRLSEDGTLLAEGIPFAGSSDYCKNRSLPVEAIVYLEQAPVTTIRRLRGYEAFSKIWEGISVNTWDKTDMERVSSAAQKVAAEIPVFQLSCTPDETAVTVLEAAIGKQVNP